MRGKLLAQSRQEGALVVHVGPSNHKALLQRNPNVSIVTPHYAGYPTVRVRRAAVDETAVGQLLTDAWRRNTPKLLVASVDVLH